MTNARILIVEDEQIVALDLKNKIMGLGYPAPAIASSGKEAIEKAAELRPDLVLMDIVLKGPMDGVEAAAHIWDRLRIPVVFITAHADDETSTHALEAYPGGLVRIIIKPFEIGPLKSAIQLALQARGGP